VILTVLVLGIGLLSEVFNFHEIPLRVICLSGAPVLDRKHDKLPPCLGFILRCFKEEVKRIF